MDFVAVVVVIGWLAGAVLAGFVAEAKGRSGPGWLVGGMFFSPLLALIALAAMPAVASKKKGVQ